MIVKHWPVGFTAGYGHEFPSSYVCFDLETTGFDKKCDVIIEIGHVLVVDGEVTDELSVLLDWSKNPVVPQHWLRDRIANLRQTMSQKGIAHHLPYDRLVAEGIDAMEALAYYRDLFANLKAQGMPVVGHNVYRFDEPMLEANLLGFEVADEFAFGDWQLWDTLCLEAATQVGPKHPKALPQPGDTLRSWMARAAYIKAETNLTRTLLAKYDLAAKYGLDTRDSHSACYDARLCHHLMQEYRRMLTAEPEPEPVRLAPVPVPPKTKTAGPRPPLPPSAFVTPNLFAQIEAAEAAKDEVVYGDPTRRRRQRNR